MLTHEEFEKLSSEEQAQLIFHIRYSISNQNINCPRMQQWDEEWMQIKKNTQEERINQGVMYRHQFRCRTCKVQAVEVRMTQEES